MAMDLLANDYCGNGKTIQFHANTTYEAFVGGLAPCTPRAQSACNSRQWRASSWTPRQLPGKIPTTSSFSHRRNQPRGSQQDPW